MQASGPEAQTLGSRNTQRRRSELDSVSVSELVPNQYQPEGEWARATDAQGAEAGDQDESLQAPEVQTGDSGRQFRDWTEEGQAATDVEAAAAVPTAAVATTAELEAIQAAEVEQKVGSTGAPTVQELVEPTRDDPAPELQRLEDELDEVY
jgi:hypothetical protein